MYAPPPGFVYTVKAVDDDGVTESAVAELRKQSFAEVIATAVAVAAG